MNGLIIFFNPLKQITSNTKINDFMTINSPIKNMIVYMTFQNNILFQIIFYNILFVKTKQF